MGISGKVKYSQQKPQSSMDAFLNSLGNKHTKSMYHRGVELFVEFYGKSIDEILAERKDDFT